MHNLGNGGSVEINVDLAGLQDFADTLRADTQDGLQPGSQRVRGDLAFGTRFGVRSGSGYVYAAKRRYQQSLTRAMETLTGYVQAGGVLAAAAERVAAKYKDADAMSAASTAEVEAELSAAVAQAQARLAAAQAAARRGQVRFE